jgi:hypothetical protein
MGDEKFPKMQDIKVGEEVTITLPAMVWIGFHASYMSNTGYTCANANTICRAVYEAVVDPLFVKESRAESERQAAQQQEMMSKVMPWIPGPDVPPDLSGLEGGTT